MAKNKLTEKDEIATFISLGIVGIAMIIVIALGYGAIYGDLDPFKRTDLLSLAKPNIEMLVFDDWKIVKIGNTIDKIGDMYSIYVKATNNCTWTSGFVNVNINGTILSETLTFNMQMEDEYHPCN